MAERRSRSVLPASISRRLFYRYSTVIKNRIQHLQITGAFDYPSVPLLELKTLWLNSCRLNTIVVSVSARDQLVSVSNSLEVSSASCQTRCRGCRSAIHSLFLALAGTLHHPVHERTCRAEITILFKIVVDGEGIP